MLILINIGIEMIFDYIKNNKFMIPINYYPTIQEILLNPISYCYIDLLPLSTQITIDGAQMSSVNGMIFYYKPTLKMF